VKEPSEDDLTMGPSVVTRAAPSASLERPASVRFVPGEIIAGRYRLVALLGRGGMGEVYRAEDLTLDQPVALKFLPELGGSEGDADNRLTQFHNELRMARQVSHKNVCRLYDVGEANGRRFLTMEYVDGEDLAALLKRIGRFPQDRATDIARQLCAGIAAAHQRGIVHRDLKPANVMIDAEGQVRITDFGIATATADAGAMLAGTPQYMAPEQLAGKPATIRSDIYALGLILYDISPGRRAHPPKTIADLRLQHDTGTLVTPTSIVRDLDPAIERVILRCLERDPERRPASALTVAAALPGGHALADALAAGETPSPDLLAAAAETEAVPVLRGLALLAVLVASFAVYIPLSPRATLAALVPLDKPPAVLADRAQQVLASFGYADAPADTATGIQMTPDFPRWLAEQPAIDRWAPSRVRVGPALVFWYRTSPRDLDPLSLLPSVSPTDPPLTLTGMSLVILDTRGRLQQFNYVPPQRDTGRGETRPPDWTAAFRAADLPQASFTGVEPEWTPRTFADTRSAWEGPSPDDPEVRLRVEAAAYRGRIVSFEVLGPWARPSQMQPLTKSLGARLLSTFSVVAGLLVLLAAILLARRNLRANRADRRSAARLALIYLVVDIAAWTFGGHPLSTVAGEINTLYAIVASAAFRAAMLWVIYLALEPYGRRFWPDGLLGWTRLFSGHLRDPRIGREILIGCALGGILMLVDLTRALAPYLAGRPPGIPVLGQHVEPLAGAARLFITWDQEFYNSVQSALVIVMVVIVLRLIVRRTWIAVAISLVAVSGMAGANLPQGGVAWMDTLMQVSAIGLILLAIFRFGLLVTAVMLIVDNIPTAVPVLTASWASTPGSLSIALVLALACFGFYASRAGQPLFGDIGDG
jgi:serine/threonine-protein kinase